ncbi:MAG: mechanosensitive ion channel [Verrucomicrobia subdivision 3 bacterium]|nr:mechanosensitive ion channel [Limisphaerales bacterium]
MEWKDKIATYVVEKGPHLLGALVIIVLGVLAARWFGKLMFSWLSRRELEPPVRMLITRVAKLLVVAFALLIAVGTVGFNIMPLVTGIGVVGVGISLAMQGVLGNLVAGLLIIFTKPFRVGEYIEIIGVQGLVDSIELFNTTLLHPDRSRVVVPNRKIVGEVLHNYGTIRQLNLSVGVSYDTNIPTALAAVRDVLSKNARVLKEVAPVVGVTTLADSSINVAVKPWASVTDYGPAHTEIYQAIIDRFREAGITIPFPQREIRILNGAPSAERHAERVA